MRRVVLDTSVIATAFRSRNGASFALLNLVAKRLLVPLLTAWCPDPLAVLLMNTGLTMLLGLAAPLLLAEVVCPRPGGRAAATLANALMIALAPDRVRENLLFECCYPQGIALGCGDMDG